jgi:hypothetical protein
MNGQPTSDQIETITDLINKAVVKELEQLVALPNIQIPAGVHVKAIYVSAVENRLNALKQSGSKR